MKTFLVTVIALCLVFISINCKKSNSQLNSDNADNSECNSPSYNVKFLQISGPSTYSQVKSIFGVEGNNFRNDFNGEDTIKYYKWSPCSSNGIYFIECWFMNSKLILSRKTINDNSCSNNISSQSFSELVNGMSYDQVKSILKDGGDNFRNDFDYPSTNVKTKYYAFITVLTNQNI